MTKYYNIRLNMKSDRTHWAEIEADDFEEVKDRIKHQAWIEVFTDYNTEFQENLMIKTENIESVKDNGAYSND